MSVLEFKTNAKSQIHFQNWRALSYSVYFDEVTQKVMPVLIYYALKPHYL